MQALACACYPNLDAVVATVDVAADVQWSDEADTAGVVDEPYDTRDGQEVGEKVGAWMPRG